MKLPANDIIEYMITDIKTGNRRHVTQLAVTHKWNIAYRTSQTYYTKALQTHNSRQAELNKELFELDKAGTLNERRLKIMDITERKQILTKIARGELTIYKPAVTDKASPQPQIIPTFAERRAAITELNKMDGAYDQAEQVVNKLIVIKPSWNGIS